MNCETCGNPIDREDAERGSCTHCGVVLAHVLRAAEKAEIVRRVVAQGHNVRIEGDRIEAGAPPGPPREGPDGAIVEARATPIAFIAATTVITLSIGVFSFLSARSHVEPSPDATKRVILEPQSAVLAPTRMPIAPPPETPTTPRKENAAPTTDPAAKSTVASRAPALPRTVDGVIAANKAQYDRCQRAELTRNPSAARRYSVAVTVDGQGHAEWVEILSEASAEMKWCVQSVTRGLDFPRPAAGSSRSIVTLSFSGTP